MIKTLYSNSFSEQGVRENNEDFVSSVNDQYFIVCDGMGGHGHGEVASQTVTESLCAFFQVLGEQAEKSNLQAALNYAVERLNEKDIYGDSEHKMGTTVVLAALTESSVLVGHVGDSRLYHIRPGSGLLFKTKDHSQVQEWVDAEIITEEEARTHPKKNLITRCVQPRPSRPVVMEIDELSDIQTGDYLFLCTDGVTDAMTDAEIVSIVSSEAITDAEKISDIKNTCAEKSHDNYSGFLLKIETALMVKQGVKDKKTVEAVKPVKKEEFVFCTNCSAKLKKEYRYCHYCGASMTGQEFSYCTKCGNRISAGQKECSDYAKRKSRRNKIIKAVNIICYIGFIVCLLLLVRTCRTSKKITTYPSVFQQNTEKTKDSEEKMIPVDRFSEATDSNTIKANSINH
jgi:serine/threonine protein phosphatase PrpC